MRLIMFYDVRYLGSFGDEIFEPHSVYTRRQSTEGKRKSKGRASFTPAPKTEFAS
jgi:hypothetical protein